jgi:putative phage-type endonuclease
VNAIAVRTVGPRKLRLLQGSPEWLAARREHITATDIPALLGISPWKCEQDVADEKLAGASVESTLVMRVGSALEDLIADAYAAQEGRTVRRVRGLWESRRYPWAAASPDATAAGRLVELKWTGSRSRFAGGLPKDVEAQVAWQMLVAEAEVADVATLTVDEGRIRVFEVRANATLAADLVQIAEDFRRRLMAGGPFAQSADSAARHFPADNGTYLPATPDLVELVAMFRAAKETAKSAVDSEKGIGNALRALLRDASGIEGLLTYRKSADSTRVNWPAVATAYRALIDGHDADELDALVSTHSETSQGPRVLRLLKEIA